MSDAGFILFVIAMLAQIGWAYWVERLNMKYHQEKERNEKKRIIMHRLDELISYHGKFMDSNGKSDSEYNTKEVTHHWETYNNLMKKWWST